MKRAIAQTVLVPGLALLASAIAAAADAAAATGADAPAADARAGKPPFPGVDPARTWEIFLVQHTHTDLGFTAPQPEILRDHLRFIDEALRMVRETDGFPEEARFKWTCEVTYGVEAWLRARPPEAALAFVDAVRRGRIEVAGLPVNLTDLASEEVVIRTMAALRDIKALGIPVRSAMQCDTNGYPWALPRLFREAGIRWFASASNETRSRIPFAVPTGFTWESPDGSQVLAWRGFHYHAANLLGLATSVEETEKNMAGALGELTAKGYPHDILLLQISGYYTDNSPPSTRPCEIVRAWNAKWGNPRLRTATLSEWFEALEARAKAPFERRRIAWPDWWADGNGSAPLEVSVVREAQDRLLAADAMGALGGAGLGSAGRPFREGARRAYGAALLFDEHTFGAHSSISDPWSEFTKVQWGHKAARAFEAAAGASSVEEQALSSIAGRLSAGDAPGIALVNPTSWARAGRAAAAIPEWALPGRVGTAAFHLVDLAGGREVPYQLIARRLSDVQIIVEAPEVPALGWRTLRIEAGAPAPVESPFRLDGTTIESDLVKVTVSPETGAITSLRDKVTGVELAGTEGPWGLGSVIHERIVDPAGRDALWPIKVNPGLARASAKGVKVEAGLRGPLAASLRVSGKAGDVDFVEEIALRRGDRRVKLTVTVRKPGRPDPEAVYVAFPFAFREPEVRAEVVGGVMRPGIDQVPGMATDWHSVGRWVRLEEGSRGAAWATLDAPLVQFGGINTGRYLETLPPRRPAFFSWAMNNYWFTNFPAIQAGEFRFRYAILPFAEGAGSDSEASRFAREFALPLRAAILTPGKGTAPATESLIRIEPANVSVAALKAAEDGRGVILRIAEEDGKEARAVLSTPLRVERAERATFLEEPLGGLEVRAGGDGRSEIVVPVPPRGTVTVRLAPLEWK